MIQLYGFDRVGKEDGELCDEVLWKKVMIGSLVDDYVC